MSPTAQPLTAILVNESPDALKMFHKTFHGHHFATNRTPIPPRKTDPHFSRKNLQKEHAKDRVVSAVSTILTLDCTFAFLFPPRPVNKPAP